MEESRKIELSKISIKNGKDGLEYLQYGWVVCHCCSKTFLSMKNATSHYMDEHMLSVNSVESNKKVHEIE